MRKLEAISDEELLELVNGKKAIEDIQQRLDFVYAITGLEDIINKRSREINGEEYTLIVKPFSKEEGAQVVNWFVEKTHEAKLEELEADLNKRIDSLKRNDQKVKRLKAELDAIKSATDSNKYVKAGFQAAQSGKAVSVYQDFTWENDRKDYEDCALGYAYHFYVQEVECQINELLGEEAELEEEVTGETMPYLSSPRHKLLLLHQLGVLEFLADKYKHKFKSKRQFAFFISLVIGLKTKENAGTISKDINKLLYDKATSQKDQNIFTASAIEAVEEALRKVGFKDLPF